MDERLKPAPVADPAEPKRRHRDSLEDNGSAPVYGDEPAPPYQHLLRDLVTAVFRVDPDRVKPHLPPGVRLAPSNTGLVFVYNVQAGWGMAPYARAFAALALKSHNSPDTGEAAYIMGAVATAPASQIMRSHYDESVVDGEVEIASSQLTISGRGIVGGQDWMRVRVRTTETAWRFNAGSDRYFALTAAGLTAHDIAYAANAANGELLEMTFGDAATPALRAMRPTELLFGQHLPVMSASWSEPHFIGREVEEATLDTYLGLLEDSGRAAAIAREDGTVLRANGPARRILGVRGSGSFVLPIADAGDRARLGMLVRQAVRGEAIAEPFLVHLGLEQMPVLVRVSDVNAARALGNAVLLTLEWPAEKAVREVGPLLQLLGLTPAESRIAVRAASSRFRIRTRYGRRTRCRPRCRWCGPSRSPPCTCPCRR